MFNVEFPIHNRDFFYLDLSKTYPRSEVREKLEKKWEGAEPGEEQELTEDPRTK